MPKVYIMCGRICSGKSTHARELREAHGAVILSVDELMLALFGHDAGSRHDEYVKKAQALLYRKSVEIVRAGASVILDWGFWTGEERAYARRFYAAEKIPCEFHYIDIDGAEWHRRLEKRNRAVREGLSDDYYVDEGLAAKFEAVFEPPARGEIDVWLS